MSTATQTTYTNDPDLGNPGEYSDSSKIKDRVTKSAAEILRAGLALVLCALNDKKVRAPKRNHVDLVFSADLGADNVTAGTIKTVDLDGNEEIIAIEETYASSHAATVGEIIASLEAGDSDISASLGGANNRTLSISVGGDKYLEITVAFAVTGGSAKTITPTYGSTDVIFGFSGWDPNIEKTAAGEALFNIKDPVPVVRKGRIFVQPETNLARTDTIYARTVAGSSANQDAGSVTKTVGSPVNTIPLTGFVELVRGTSTAGGIAEIELILPGRTS